MFWKYNTTSSTQIDTILGKENVTLKQLMDEEDILNEAKVQNRQLIEFLLKPQMYHELITLAVSEPEPGVDECNRYKYANIACEIIMCDISSLNEAIAGDEWLLMKLYQFLEEEQPLNPLLASFFSKIMAVLITKKTEQNWVSNQFTTIQVLDFLKSKENFIPLLLAHLNTSAIMDLTLKLMTQVEGVENRQNILNYLDSQRMIQNLVSMLDPQIESSKHNNVAQLLCDFIQLARENQRNSSERNDPDPLLNALEAPDTVALLLEHILAEEKCETAIVGGIQVLLELLDAGKSSIPKFAPPGCNFSNANFEDANDNDGKQRVVESTVKEIIKRLKDFHNLLADPPRKDAIITSVGVLEPPLGNTRLQVTRLLATLITIGGADMAQEVIALGMMGVLIDLFFAFPWNNFLHTQVQACIFAALSLNLPPSEQGDSIALSKHLLVNCKLVERILDAWKDNDEKTSSSPLGGVRRGYMGHLINIANNLVQMCSDSPVGLMLKDNLPETADALKEFNENTLKEANRVQEALLGGVHPHTANEDSDEYGDMPFSTSSTGAQMFSDYQNQQLSLTNFYDTYGGFNDEDFEFKDGEDALQTIESRSGMNFDLSEGDLVQQHELFKQVCSQNINTLDDADDQIFDDKDHTFQTVIEKDAEQEQQDVDVERNSSSDSDEGEMETELWNPPNEASEAPSILLADDPWGAKNPGNAPTTGSGWADFSGAVFEAKFENSKEVETDLKVDDAENETETTLKQVKQDSIDFNIAQPHPCAWWNPSKVNVEQEICQEKSEEKTKTEGVEIEETKTTEQVNLLKENVKEIEIKEVEKVSENLENVEKLPIELVEKTQEKSLSPRTSPEKTPNPSPEV